MRNNNQVIIRRLTKRCLLANKSRNIFALIAIVLTTVLITAVFTIGISLSDGMQQMLIQSYGRSTQVDFQYLTKDEVQRVAAHPRMKEYGLSRLITVTTEGVFRQAQGELHTADDNFAKFTFSQPTTGRLPKLGNEIALSSWILDAMKLPREIGQVVHLNFEVAGTAYSMDFTVSGFWNSDVNLQPYGILYITDALADKLLADVNPAQTRLGGGYYGVTKMTANIDGKMSQLEENVNRILKDTRIDAKTAGVNMNGAYTGSSTDGDFIAAMAIIIGIIMLSGYLLIYNIFYISVMRDVRFYGLLKTIGATQKQLRRVVNFQALLLCAIAIPVGLVIGFLLGIVLIPVLLSFLSIDYVSAPLNPWIFVLGAALALITVLVSCNGPAQKAGKVSPMEALRYTGIAATSAKKTKQTRGGVPISRMAWSNMFRNKKKAALVIMSLSVGLMLFNIMYTLVGSFDVNKFLQDRINGDFLIADTDYFSFARPYAPSYSLNDQLLSRVKKLDGVQEVAKVYYEDGIMKKTDVSAHVSNINTQIYGFDSYWLDKLEKAMIEGNFDREKFLSGNYLLLGLDSEGLIRVGDTVTFTLHGDDGEKHSYKVMGRVNYEALHSLGAHFIMKPGISVYLPSAEFGNFAHPDIMSATVIADKRAVSSLQKEIGFMLAKHQKVDFRSRADYIAEMKSENQQFALIGFTLCAVILLIGMLNSVNTTMTNIFSRKQELAMLQSVGMTAKQGKKMLVLECIYYTAIVMLIFVTVGYAVSYFVVKTITEGSAAYTYHFSFAPFVIYFAILLLIACILPIQVYKSISRESVVQRLREYE